MVNDHTWRDSASLPAYDMIKIKFKEEKKKQKNWDKESIRMVLGAVGAVLCWMAFVTIILLLDKN